MREIQASDAKTHLPSPLDEVERGETVITHQARPSDRPHRARGRPPAAKVRASLWANFSLRAMTGPSANDIRSECFSDGLLAV